MSIIDRVRRRYEAIGTQPVAIVPEWEDEDGRPTEVYAEPWTVRDAEKFAKLHGSDKDWTAHIVVAKARDKDGQPLFDAKDVLRLQAEGEEYVVARIAGAIRFSMTVEDAKKNLTEIDSPPP